MAKNRGNTYVESRLTVDGHEYISCRFENCTLVYAGGPLPTMGECVFVNCDWTFEGPAALTVQFMSALYGGGMRELIEHTFDNIRGASAPGVKLN